MLVDKLAEKYELPNVTMNGILYDLLTTMNDELLDGNNIELRGFGTFKPGIRKGREGRDPRNGNPVVYPDKRIVKFKWSLKEAVE